MNRNSHRPSNRSILEMKIVPNELNLSRYLDTFPLGHYLVVQVQLQDLVGNILKHFMGITLVSCNNLKREDYPCYHETHV